MGSYIGLDYNTLFKVAEVYGTELTRSDLRKIRELEDMTASKQAEKNDNG